MPLPFAVTLGRSLIKDAFKSQKKEQKKDAAQKAKPKVSGPKITEKFLGTKQKEEKSDTPTTKYKPPTSSTKMGETGIESVDKSLSSIQQSIISLRKSLKSSSDFTVKQKRIKRVTEEVEDQKKEEENQEKEAKKRADSIKKKIGAKLKPGIDAVKNFFIQIMIGSFLLWLKKNAEEITKQVKEFAEKVEDIFNEINDNVIQPLWNLSKAIIGPILTEITKIVLPNFDQENKEISDKLSALVKSVPFVGQEIQKIEDAIRGLKIQIPEDKLKQGQQQASGSTPPSQVPPASAPQTQTQQQTAGASSPPPAGTPPAQGQTSTVSTGQKTESQQGALDVLAKYESGAAVYNAVNQYGTKGGRGVEGFSGDITKAPWNPDKRALTDMTIGEIKARQYDDKSMSKQQWLSSGKLHAVGRYQFIGNTLPGVAERAGIPDSAKFTPEVQDIMALQLMKERGISPWVGPSDKATGPERALVERARKDPIPRVNVQSGSTTPPAQVAPQRTAPSSAAIVQYITGDKTYKGGFGQDSFVDVAGHGTQATYHEHISFKDRATAVRAYKFLTSRGIQVTEFEGYTPVGSHSARGGHFGPVGGSPTYDDTTDGTAFDIPGSQWGGSGAIGETDYAGSRKVRKLLNDFLIQEAGGRVGSQANGVSASTQYERQGGGTVVVPVGGGASQMMSGPSGGSTTNPPTQGRVNNSWWTRLTNMRLFKGG